MAINVLITIVRSHWWLDIKSHLSKCIALPLHSLNTECLFEMKNTPHYYRRANRFINFTATETIEYRNELKNRSTQISVPQICCQNQKSLREFVRLCARPCNGVKYEMNFIDLAKQKKKLFLFMLVWGCENKACGRHNTRTQRYCALIYCAVFCGTWFTCHFCSRLKISISSCWKKFAIRLFYKSKMMRRLCCFFLEKKNDLSVE